jgi:hypothetical protein
VQDAAVALGWRVHSWWATVVAVTGPASSPHVIHRDRVTLVDDASSREPYHAAVAVPLDDAPALIDAVARAAAAAAATAIAGFASSLGPLAAIGVVGGDRQVPTDLARVLRKHALLHASERDLYERAVVEGATHAGLPVATLPATKGIFDRASEIVGVPVEPPLAALGRSLGPPWQKDHKEATAAALVALHAIR